MTVHGQRVHSIVTVVNSRVCDGVRCSDSAPWLQVSKLCECGLCDEVVQRAAGVGQRHGVTVGRPVLHDPSLAHSAPTHHAKQILVELFGEERVQERVGARVEWEEENEEDLRLGDCDERVAEGGRQPKERDGEETREVGEDEKSHALGDVRVVGADHDVVNVHLTVHVEVTRTDGDKRCRVDDEQGEHVDLVNSVRRLHRQTDARLAIAADTDERQCCHEQGEDPARQQDAGCLTETKTLGEMDGVANGVPPLHGDDCECEDGVAGGEDGEKTGHLTATLVLPGDGEVKVDALCVQVDGGQ